MAVLDSISSLVAMEMAREHIPGLSLAVLHAAETIWSVSLGISDVENQVPAKETTVYRTASLAKPITGVAAMQLAERGALDLDAPVQTYVHDFPEKQWRISTRQLLGHIAGIRTYKADAETYNTVHYWSLSEVVNTFRDDPLAYQPGTKYLYSTLGYVLAGRVIEAVSGMSYVDYVKGQICAPAGMVATGADDVYTVIPNRSRGYTMAPDGSLRNAPLLDTSSKIPGGGLASTAIDMIRFVRAIDNGKLLGPKSVAEMLMSLTTRDGKTTSYGLGWGLDKFRERPMRLHTGGQAGVATLLRYFPDDHAAVAILCNLEEAKITRLADLVSEALLFG
jgi:CubicO group peptidase (beta-lactamase class C family)